jgi:hypothetical protein
MKDIAPTTYRLQSNTYKCPSLLPVSTSCISSGVGGLRRTTVYLPLLVIDLSEDSLLVPISFPLSVVLPSYDFPLPVTI